MYLRREIEPDGLPLIVDAIKTKDGEVKELRMITELRGLQKSSLLI